MIADNDEFWDWVLDDPAGVGRALLRATELLGAWQSLDAILPEQHREPGLNEATLRFLEIA